MKEVLRYSTGQGLKPRKVEMSGHEQLALLHREDVVDVTPGPAGPGPARRKPIVVVCSYCRKVDVGDGPWLDLLTFVERIASPNMSHGICPACMTEFHFPAPGR